MARRTPRPRVAASTHNAVVTAAMKRVDDHLEERLAALVEPILRRAGEQAARAFREKATDHLTASALRRADRDAVLRSGVAASEVSSLLPVLVAAGGLDGVEPTSTMVCLKPRVDEAAAIADPGGAPPETLHVTLAYLGQTEEATLEPLRDALAQVAATHGPLSGRVGGYGEFRPPGCGILLPDVPGLVELRVAVTEALVEAGVDYGRDHGFQAHITVDGRPEDGEIDSMLERATGAPLHFDALLVVRGDATALEVPLVGVAPVTASALTAAGDPGDVASRRAQLAQALDELKKALQEGDPVAISAARAAINDAKERFGDALGGTTPLWTAPAGDEVFDVQALAEQIRAKTEPVRKALIQTTMAPSLAAAGLSFEVTNPLTAKALASTGAKVTGISETTRADVMQTITSAWENGLSIEHTAQILSLTMQADAMTRARTIARTELVGAVNGGSLAAVKLVQDATDSEYDKSWLTASGARYPRHELYEGLDGQTVALDEKFDVGGSALDHPGDPDGDEGEVINCRCALRYVERGEAAQGDESGGDATGATDAASDQAVADQEEAGAPIGGGEAVAESETAAPSSAPPETPETSQMTATTDTISVGDGPPVPPQMVERIQELGLDRPLGTFVPTSAIGKELYGGTAKSTEALYKVGGEWTPERAELHDDIVAAHFEGKTPTVGTPTTFFTAGGSASGKSAALFDVNGQEMTLEEIGKRSDVVWVDPDRIKAMLPEYGELRDANDTYAASGVHEESSELAKRITSMAYDRGYSVIVDTTGSSRSFVQKMQEAAAAGRDVKTTMVSIPTNEAIVRAMARGDRSGRYVAVDPLKYAHAGASRQLAIWQNDPSIGEWRVYDNSGAKAELVAEGEHGKVTVHDSAKYAAILAKANE